MHAALISLVLMSGACGDVPAACGEFPEHDGVSIYRPMPSPPCHCGAGCGPLNLPVPPDYCGCPQYTRPELHTQPAWTTPYRPRCYFFPEHRMLFDPADYSQPYPYRERFNYPWNDPRCHCGSPGGCP